MLINFTRYKRYIVFTVFMLFLLFITLVMTHQTVHAEESSFADGDGSADSPYLIETAEQLDKMRGDTGAHYELIADIDLSSLGNWKPIESFSGTLNGNGHVIKNLTIDRTPELYTDEKLYENNGLFGRLISANISNLGLTNVHIRGGSYTGALAGRADSSAITNVYSTGRIAGESVMHPREDFYEYTANQVGGLVGRNYNTSIKNSYSNSSVSGHTWVGGLIGYIYKDQSRISNSYSAGTVSALANNAGGFAGENYGGSIWNSHSTSNVTGNSVVGGLVGTNTQGGSINVSYSSGKVTARSHDGDMSTVGGFVGRHASDIPIKNSYSTSDVSGARKTTGGFAGYSQGLIENSYSTGNVHGTVNVGGFAGHLDFWGNVKNSYSLGNVTGNDYVGGFNGRKDHGFLTSVYSIGEVVGTTNVGGLVGGAEDLSEPTQSYWNTDTSGQSDSAGGTGLTTAEMKDLATYTNTDESSEWDFDWLWGMDSSLNDGYPHHQWNSLQEIYLEPDTYIFDINTIGTVPLSVKALHSTGLKQDVSDKVRFQVENRDVVDSSVYDSAELRIYGVGETTVTVSYFNKKAEATIIVQDGPVLKGISSNVKDIDLQVGTAFDLNDLKVYANYTDGKEEKVTEGVHFSISDTNGVVTIDETKKELKANKAGETTLTISYENETLEVPVTVHHHMFSLLDGYDFTFSGGLISIPENAIDNATKIFVNEPDRDNLPLGDDQQLASDVFEITKDTSNKFQEDITLTFNFDKDQFNKKDFELAIYWLDEQNNEWIQLNNIDVNWDEGAVSGTTDHFTKFAIIATEKESSKEPEVNFTSLIELYEEHKDISQGNYTDKSWEAFTLALADVEALLSDREKATQEDADSAYDNLQNAIDNLEEMIEAEKDELVNLLDQALGINSNSYTEESYENLSEAIYNAEEVVYNENATQEEVDAAYEKLQTAISSLEKKNDEGLDKDRLIRLVIAANSRKAENYTVDSFNALNNAIENAENIIEKDDATQAEVDEAFELLQESIEGLVTTETKTKTVTEKISFNTIEKEDPTLTEGELKIKQEGKYGKKIITYKVTYENEKEVGREIIGEEIAKKPVDEIVLIGTKVTDSEEPPVVDPDPKTPAEPKKPEPRQVKVSLGEESEVNAGDIVVIQANGTDTMLTMPDKLPSDARVIIHDANEKMDRVADANLIIAGDIIDVSIVDTNGQSIQGPFTLTMQYDSENYSENEVAIYYYDEEKDEWLKQDGGIVDTEAGTITVEVPHFSMYGVFVEKEGEASSSKGSSKSTDDDKLPSTATNTFHLLVIGCVLFVLGVISLIFIRRKAS